ncbi:MAG: glycosyltransferase [Candidatus Acidiferrales bacterium]|jgi:glycosyltransferase involved in cell wall biosynthesis
MQALVAVEHHYKRGPDGHIYGEGPTSYSFWSTYLDTFEKIAVLSRVGVSSGPFPKEARADGPSVSFLPLPDYQGPWQYFLSLSELNVIVRRAIAESDAYILRVPGLVGRLAWHEIRRLRKPYALEVVGDPWDALGPGAWPSMFRPFFRQIGARGLRVMCRGAAAVHYVTEKALQRRYPAANSAYSVGFSDALMYSAFAPAPILEERHRRVDFRKPLRIGFIGSLAQLYKGPDVLMNAAAVCCSACLNLEFFLAGDGRHANAMKGLAERLGITRQTRFLGQLASGQAIRDFLDSVDVFVMPSRQEGLPRAMLEAMARGCPCIGSDVGGIPELLAAEDLVPPNDYKALARKIMEVTADPQRMKTMSARNLARAKQFDPEVLREVRRAFYDYVKTHSQ